MNQKHQEIKKTCPYRVNWVNHNCHHKQNSKHICKAKNCPILDSNRIMVVRNEFSDSRGISAIPSYALKSSKPILIRTDKGLVPLKVDVNSQSCEEQKHVWF